MRDALAYSRAATRGGDLVEEARLEQLDTGLAPVTDGWFVVSIRDAAWVTNEALGAACIFERDEVSFPDIGFTLAVVQPGQPAGRYHREANQEDFLVLAGECLGHRLRALGAGAPPRRRRRDGDQLARRGVRPVPEMATGATGRLERIAVGSLG